MQHHPFPIIIALGSNLGDRRGTLEQACALMARRGIQVTGRSRLYWTRPWGVLDQPAFLNAAVAVRTRLLPGELLDRLLAIEQELGRRRTVRWGARRLDLDLLLYGWVRCQTPKLTLPHPQIARRDFVLAPLIDLDVPPPLALAPQGWRCLLEQLPQSERTLIASAPWG